MFSSLALVAITAGCINALSVHDLPEIPEVSSYNNDFRYYMQLDKFLSFLDSPLTISNMYLPPLEWRPVGDVGGWQQWMVQLPPPGGCVPRLPDRAHPRGAG